MCKEELDKKFFKSNKKRKDGLQSQCIECQREYRRQHYLNNKQKYIYKSSNWQKELVVWWKDYKKQFKCDECGEDHPATIDFHHPNDDKEKSVSRWLSDGSKKKMLKEIEKCIPLCANCHRKKHWKE
jgi:hypothetical protein